MERGERRAEAWQLKSGMELDAASLPGIAAAAATGVALLEIFFDDPIRLPRIRLAGFSRKVDRRRRSIVRR
jgi:hypothetical protein